MNVLLYAGSGDIFTMGHTLTTRLGGLIGLVLIIVIGLKALGHIIQDRPALAIVLVLVALIPAWFILDPTSAMNTLKSTIHSL